MTDTNGLKAILKHNETAQPNDDLLNTLKTAIPQFFDKDGNFKTDKFEDELKKNNIAEARDGYKLGFVGKDYARLQVGLKSETMIVPDKKHNDQLENANSGNVFITGDNLEALRHLVNAYENKIKLIYIDPPYNTGKEFVYSDKFEFTDEKLKSILGYTDEEITRLKSIQGKSSHSAWLTFIYPRLKIAQRMLKADGLILVSIDEHECHNLLNLTSEIFGEDSFETLVWRKNGKQGNTKKISRFKNTHEFIVVIYRNIYNTTVGKMKLLPNWKSEKTNVDNDDRGNWESGIISLAEEKSDQNSDNYYSITLPSGRVITREFYVSKEEFDILCNDNRIYFPKDGDGVPRLKIFEKEEQEYFFDSIIDDMGTFTNAREEIENIFGIKEIFDTPKPVKMLKELIRATSLRDSFILDFFAGSSTTAHAVMQLNAEDGGNRKFIMVQLDEKTNPDSEARKAGYNTIDEIARKRIELAGKKILADYESDMVKQTNGWDKDIGFKHYRLVTPDVKTLEKIIEFNPEETNLIADDMIKPFEYKKTETGGLDTILNTWLIDDGYRFDTPVEEITFGNYGAHYVREAQTLYLINMGWDTKALKDMLNQIGTNKLLVKTIVVYPYSFEFEAMRELKTNIKTNLDNSPNLLERY